jgi:hypothetical protein
MFSENFDCIDPRIFKRLVLERLWLYLVLIVHQVIPFSGRANLIIFFQLHWKIKWVFHITGDTFTDGSIKYTMTSMNVPEPVMSLAINPSNRDSTANVSNMLVLYLFDLDNVLTAS